MFFTKKMQKEKNTNLTFKQTINFMISLPECYNHYGKFLVPNLLFSVLNVLGLLKVGFVGLFLFNSFERNIKISSITILLKTLIIPTFLTLICCNLLESFKISWNLF